MHILSKKYSGTEDIIKGKYTQAELAGSLTQESWDNLFGETHNPDGSIKGAAPIENVESESKNDGILDLSKITTQEARIEAFDNLSIGSQFYDNDGSGPYTKTKER